jgi:hypothetical protein
MRLDMDRPFGTVSGLPGVCFQQDGRYFGRNGHLMRDPESSEPEPAEEASAPVEEAPSPVKVGTDDMRLAENKRLKAQMDIYGEPWSGAAAAKRFLEGKQ